jgi:hypothetical protein
MEIGAGSTTCNIGAFCSFYAMLYALCAMRFENGLLGKRDTKLDGKSNSSV